jgi:cysteinyl-tRNA synthetase
MNITDVEDKIIRNAMERGQSLEDYTRQYTDAFLEDAARLRLEKPERLVFATHHIDDMVRMIQGLAGKSTPTPAKGRSISASPVSPNTGACRRSTSPATSPARAWT